MLGENRPGQAGKQAPTRLIVGDHDINEGRITMKPTVYVVTMYRWGDQDAHSYPLGVYSQKTAAQKAGAKEQEYRGGKYEPGIKPFVVIDKFKARKSSHG